MNELFKSYLRSALKAAGASMVTTALMKYGASPDDVATIVTGSGGAAAILVGLVWSHLTHRAKPTQ